MRALRIGRIFDGVTLKREEEPFEEQPLILYIKKKKDRCAMCGFPTITMEAVDYYRERGMDLHILDLRDPGSYESSHLEGAVNLPFEDLEERMGELPRDKILVLYCYRGGQSLLASRRLSRLGYQVVNVANGIHCYRGKYLVHGH